MRIIAGYNKSRNLKTLKGENTRPTLDKVKEAVFSSIGTYFNGGNCLDLFSGSGAIGLEALSRGMDFCVFSDGSKEAINIIKENIKALNETNVKVLNTKYLQTLLEVRKMNVKFDLIYLDPPYKLKCIDEIMNKINEYELLKDNGKVIVESLKEDSFKDNYGSIIKYKEAVYGISKISYYRGELHD